MGSARFEIDVWWGRAVPLSNLHQRGSTQDGLAWWKVWFCPCYTVLSASWMAPELVEAQQKYRCPVFAQTSGGCMNLLFFCAFFGTSVDRLVASMQMSTWFAAQIVTLSFFLSRRSLFALHQHSLQHMHGSLDFHSVWVIRVVCPMIGLAKEWRILAGHMRGLMGTLQPPNWTVYSQVCQPTHSYI